VKNDTADLLSCLPSTNNAPLVPAEIVTLEEIFLLHHQPTPIDFAYLRSRQQLDATLLGAAGDHPSTKSFGTINLIVDKNNKIMVPQDLQIPMIKFYHDHLIHPGMTRLEKSLRQHFVWTKLTQQVQDYVKTCKTCMEAKIPPGNRGIIPPKHLQDQDFLPWHTVCVNVITPYQVKIMCKPLLPNQQPSYKTFKFQAMLMIDPATR